jgi:hypothetical protein
MKNIIILFCLFIHFLVGNAQTSENELRAKGEQNTAEALKRVKVPKGTIVTLRLTNDINSKTAQVGDVIELSVSVPIFIGGEEVAPKECYAEAIITEVKSPRGFGRPGSVTIQVSNFVAFDNNRVPLDSKPIKTEGQSRRDFAKVFAYIIIPPFSLLGFTVKGEPAEMTKGKIFHARVAEDITVNSNPSSSLKDIISNQ